MSPSSPRPADEVPALHFPNLGTIRHAVSTRHGGVSSGPYATLNLGLSTGDDRANVLENRRRFLESLQVDPPGAVFGRLSHGTDVTVFRRDCEPRPEEVVVDSSTERVFRSDAVVTDIPGLMVFLTFADCVPLLFHDAVQGVMAAAHAGWRGTAAGITGAVVRTLEREFGCKPADLQVGIGPSIGPCCYRVGPEVQTAFSRHGLEPVLIDGEMGSHLDLWETHRRHLLDADVQPDNVVNLGICTSCHVSTFFSHRAEAGLTGRFALCAGLPP